MNLKQATELQTMMIERQSGAVVFIGFKIGSNHFFENRSTGFRSDDYEETKRAIERHYGWEVAR